MLNTQSATSFSLEEIQLEAAGECDRQRQSVKNIGLEGFGEKLERSLLCKRHDVTCAVIQALERLDD